MKQLRLLAPLLAALTIVASGGVASAATGSPANQITEHYRGATYAFSPTNWHGAKDCAIVGRTSVYCFDTSAQMGTYTTTLSKEHARLQSRLAHPDVSCSGFTKIWDGPKWTQRGLAFSDWGYPMNLDSYVTVPFPVVSWFSDGQRDYSPNNCDARIFANNGGSGNSIKLPKFAESTSMYFKTRSIELYKP